MGLDIRAFRKLQPVDGEHIFNDDACYELGHFYPWANDDGYSARMEGLQGGRCYTAAESFHFRAGSYSGYNAWRNQLSLMAQHRPAEKVWSDPSGPFAELIDFSDCEGTIGPVVAAKLLEDFRAYQEKARGCMWPHTDGLWFRELYDKWMKAFEMAADGGAVSFT